MKFQNLNSFIPIFGLALFSSILSAQTAVDYERDVLPILKNHCYQCHTGAKAKLENRPLYDEENFPKVIGTHAEALIVPGNPDKSEVIRRLNLPTTDTEAMPPRRAKPLDSLQKAIVRKWIEEGAKLGAGAPPAGGSPAKPDPEKVYTWTSDTGSSLEAIFVSAENETVTLRRADNGMVVTIPKDRFSPESKKLIEQLIR